MIWGKQHGERPAAGAVHDNTGGRIDRVFVWVLLPVDLNGDKISVDRFCYNFILKGFMRHDMTPVTGGVSDAEKHRFLLLPHGSEGLLFPELPVHRVVLVKQIWVLFCLYPIRHSPLLLTADSVLHA